MVITDQQCLYVMIRGVVWCHGNLANNKHKHGIIQLEKACLKFSLNNYYLIGF